ncbi:MAG: class I SAM-dependent rRNA methyltransferase, partial [Chloroflexi bacterium]|nr:class I SAM-dependent rRNA methyltransferase [Chloroflexota bacterium]
ADAFDGLDQLRTDGAQFDMLIVDPPAFAKQAAEIERALAAYTRLARLALALLVDGGILVMASCSSQVTAERFFATITHAAEAEGRPLETISRTGHALDHPVGFPEGAYLKCLVAVARSG